MNFILESVRNYELNKCVLVQGDIHSVWAYVIDITDNRDEIEFDGFICSRGTLIDTKEEIAHYIDDDEGYAPPLLRAYKNDYSIITDLKEEEINIHWEKNLVQVFVRGVEYLKMDIATQKSYSKAISESGPYGNPLV